MIVGPIFCLWIYKDVEKSDGQAVKDYWVNEEKSSEIIRVLIFESLFVKLKHSAARANVYNIFL